MDPLHIPDTRIQIDQRFLFVVDTTTCETTSFPFVSALVAWMTGRADGNVDCIAIAEAAVAQASDRLTWMDGALEWQIDDDDVERYHRTWWTGNGASVVLIFNRVVLAEEQAQLRDRARFFVRHFVQDATGAHADIFGCDPSVLLPESIVIQGFRLLIEELVHTCAVVYTAEE